jgi:hypothetical protein
MLVYSIYYKGLYKDEHKDSRYEGTKAKLDAIKDYTGIQAVVLHEEAWKLIGLLSAKEVYTLIKHRVDYLLYTEECHRLMCTS